MARSHFSDLLDGYEQPRNQDGDPLPLGERFFVRNISGRMTADMRKRSSSRFYNFLNTALRLIIYTKAKIYGAFAMSFGILTFVLAILENYLNIGFGISASTLVICAVMTAFGTLLLFSEKPIPIILQDSPIFDFIFFEFFCIQRVHRKTDEESIHTVVATIAGALFAVFTLVVSPLNLIMGLGAVLFVGITFASPEFAYVASILLIPYLKFIPNALYIFIALSLITALSFGRKVVWGKRSVSFEQYDFLLLLMMFMILLSGIFIKGLSSFASSAVLCVMSLGYFLTSNIITNRRLADRIMNAVVVSAVPISLYSIVLYSIKCFEAKALTAPAESAFFASTSVFATFLIIAVSFSFAHTLQTHSLPKKISYISSTVINLSALFLTGEIFALMALVLGVIVYFVFKIKNKTVVAVIVPLIFLLPFGVYILPNSILTKMFEFIPSFEGYYSYIETLMLSLSNLWRNLIFGIGIGAESFAEQMAPYDIAYTNSGNLLLELALEAGILSLIVFVLMLTSRIRHRIKYSQYVRGSVVKHSQPVVSATVCALIFYGTFCYIWAEVTMFYLFFVAFAVESGMLRVSRKARDERILYYEDAKSSESSALDVSLNEHEK